MFTKTKTKANWRRDRGKVVDENLFEEKRKKNIVSEDIPFTTTGNVGKESVKKSGR